MPRFPYMNFPFPFYKNYSRTPPNFYVAATPTVSSHLANTSSFSNVNNPNNFYEQNTNGQKINRRQNLEFCTDDYNYTKSSINNNYYLFDLFGLKIYNDDVLLVSLIFFLYSEGVKDDGLFIVLILLLLS